MSPRTNAKIARPQNARNKAIIALFWPPVPIEFRAIQAKTMSAEPTNLSIAIGTVSGAFLGFTIGLSQLCRKVETLRMVGQTVRIDTGKLIYINIPLVTCAFGYIGYRINCKPTIDNALHGIAFGVIIASMNKLITNYIIDRSEKVVLPEN